MASVAVLLEGIDGRGGKDPGLGRVGDGRHLAAAGGDEGSVLVAVEVVVVDDVTRSVAVVRGIEAFEALDAEVGFLDALVARGTEGVEVSAAWCGVGRGIGEREVGVEGSRCGAEAIEAPDGKPALGAAEERTGEEGLVGS